MRNENPCELGALAEYRTKQKIDLFICELGALAGYRTKQKIDLFIVCKDV